MERSIREYKELSVVTRVSLELKISYFNTGHLVESDKLQTFAMSYEDSIVTVPLFLGDSSKRISSVVGVSTCEKDVHSILSVKVM